MKAEWAFVGISLSGIFSSRRDENNVSPRGVVMTVSELLSAHGGRDGDAPSSTGHQAGGRNKRSGGRSQPVCSCAAAEQVNQAGAEIAAEMMTTQSSVIKIMSEITGESVPRTISDFKTETCET